MERGRHKKKLSSHETQTNTHTFQEKKKKLHNSNIRRKHKKQKIRRKKQTYNNRKKEDDKNVTETVLEPEEVKHTLETEYMQH